MTLFTKDDIQSTGRLLEQTGLTVAKLSVKYAGKAAARSAKYTYKHRDGIRGTIAGAIDGAVSASNGLKGLTITKKDFISELDRICEQSNYYAHLTEVYDEKLRSSPLFKKILFQSLFVSSITAYEPTLENVKIPVKHGYIAQLQAPSYRQQASYRSALQPLPLQA